jgi:signal peptidase
VLALELTVAAALVSMVIGAVLGQPVLLGFVETGSMAPTLSPGDGFVAVPTAVAGDVEEGDVIVFRAQELQGGGLTTHRVVGETEAGYITKGDANPFTDQSGGEPPVTEDQIVATALQVGGSTLSIPYLGTAVITVRTVVQGAENAIGSVIGIRRSDTSGTGIFLVTLGVAVFLLTAVQEWLAGPKREASRSRDRSGVVDTRRLALVLLLVVLVPANAAMVVPSGTYELAVDGDAVAQNEEFVPGEPATWEYSYTNFGVMPLTFVFETESTSVSVPEDPQILWGNGDATAEVTMAVPPPGQQRVAQIREYRYLLVLPPSVIGALHDAHPLLALAAVNAVLVVGTLAVVGRTLGFGPMRIRWGPSVGITTRLRRKFG